MRFVALCLCFLSWTASALRAETSAASVQPQWNHITVESMKTSIYIGSVRLATGVFERNGGNFSTTYDARVVPWFFWSEAGTITLFLNDVEWTKLARGERTDFKGEAMNEKKKPRHVTGWAQPADRTSGKIKVRVMADGIELIFNGTYKLGS
ncbi:MAG TPA: hypothetical protein VGM64_10160 [Lacunisphaera sp.]|jgi:hypothetical protein